MPRDRSALVREVGLAIVSVLVVAGASIAGQIATYPNLASWYFALAKPPFNPPSWVFAPVWTALYALMALALWRVLRCPPESARRVALWPWMFFGARSPALGLVNIGPQLLVVLATIVLFYRLDSIAAWCLVPLAAWVAFAGVLNLSIWWLNT
jgi:tryptophan-rich sensory protein